MLGSFVQAFSMVALVLLFTRLRGGSLRDLGFSSKNPGKIVFLGVVGGIALLFAVMILSYIMNLLIGKPPEDQPFVDLIKDIKTWKDLVFPLFVGSVLAPVSEEIYFRGFTYPVLKARWGRVFGLIATALFFGSLHFDLVRTIPLAIGGLGLNLLYEKTGSIYTSMIAHSLWNTTMTLLVFISIKMIS